MLQFSAITIAGVLVLLMVMQIAYVLIYARTMRQTNFLAVTNRDPRSDESNLKVDPTGLGDIAVVLCLRGADPNLDACLDGLSKQCYSKFTLHIVVDSIDDPAMEIVTRLKSGFSRIDIHTIAIRYETCSLKCSAILTALKNVAETVEIIAFLDADTIPDKNWLIDLIRPFGDPFVGATTGNRGFWSDSPSLGTALRQTWNAAAVVQMELYNIAWGGSMAISRRCLEKANLLDHWQTAFCEDTLLTDELKKHELKLVRVADLISVNQESTTLKGAVDWISRQLLTVRLHNSKWPLVQIHAVATCFSIFGFVFSAMFFLIGERSAGLIVLSAFLLYQATNAILLKVIEQINLSLVNQRPNPGNENLKNSSSLNGWFAILLAQIVYPWACAVATFCKKVNWRGIEYDIQGRGRVSMTRYRTYREARKTSNEENRESETNQNSIA